MTRHREKLDAALEELRHQVEALVREEQLRDELYRAWQRAGPFRAPRRIAGGEFWLAFVEVDYFKRINDRFSYELADGLLQRIGKRLETFSDYIA